MLLSSQRTAVLAETVGTAVLVTAVVGSGISATRLTSDTGLQLLVNAIATVLVLAVLIHVLAPISGAHLNPVVTLVAWAAGESPRRPVAAYVVAQCAGAALGTMLAHAMYGHQLVASHAADRGGAGRLVGELVATAGLVLVVRCGSSSAARWTVPAWVGAAYFVTSSTSFANPAVTLGRALTDTFAGIGWVDVPGFVVAQLVGGAAGLLLASVLRVEQRSGVGA